MLFFYFQVSSSEDECTCGICGKILSNKSSLKRHVKLHSSASFECYLCSKTYHTKYSLKRHLQQHTEGKKWYCKCGKGFTTEFWLKRHEKSVHEGKPAYSCKTCGKSCSRTEVAAGHAIRHAGVENPNRCVKCNKGYLYKSSLKRHKCLPLHSITDKQHTCHICQKSFICLRFLKQHMKVHQKPRFICDVCGKGFRWKNCLDYHRKSCVPEESELQG